MIYTFLNNVTSSIDTNTLLSFAKSATYPIVSSIALGTAFGPVSALAGIAAGIVDIALIHNQIISYPHFTTLSVSIGVGSIIGHYLQGIINQHMAANIIAKEWAMYSKAKTIGNVLDYPIRTPEFIAAETAFTKACTIEYFVKGYELVEHGFTAAFTAIWAGITASLNDTGTLKEHEQVEAIELMAADNMLDSSVLL